MKIVVYPHDLGIGGSQLNAIEIAAAVRDLGHEVIVFGRRGALLSRIEELGLEYVESPTPGKRPSPSVAKALAALVESRGIDVVHAYEWPPALEATLAMVGQRRATVVATVMSMSVPPFIPRSAVLVVGTEEIAAAEREAGRHRLHVLEPPVDLQHNDVADDPGVADFRARHGISNDRLSVVSVARFARELKLEGTLTAIDTVGRLSERMPVQLVLVGDGPARSDVERRAAEVNRRHGEGTIVLTGQLDDPRPAYALADVALGMGGSALRALAYGKPLVVQGENGFWKTLTPESTGQFLWTGWYGVGRGAETGPAALTSELAPLLADAARRAELGAYGLSLVRERFSLEHAGILQSDIYRMAMGEPPPAPAASELAALIGYGRYYLAKRINRALGKEATDDFNARPVTARNVEAARR